MWGAGGGSWEGRAQYCADDDEKGRGRYDRMNTVIVGDKIHSRL